MILSNQKEKENWKKSKIKYVKGALIIGRFQVMQNWEKPIMDLLAKEVTKNGGRVLEIGFGLGISATKILQNGCDSYTLIEAHPKIIDKAKAWEKQITKKFQNTKIKIIEGFWQDKLSEIDGKFDGILFDSSPISEIERDKWFFPFLKKVPNLLKKDGIFTYYSNETKEFSKKHKKMLDTFFPKNKFVIQYKLIKNLNPVNCEYWNNDNMCIPVIQRKK
ncbi:MAG TPA: class I SAM-dependent methyltransferase [Ignavibacteria bacterium]|nr:class I SAM-dependent methyltransferase [Ignavibacteria bacterium]